MQSFVAGFIYWQYQTLIVFDQLPERDINHRSSTSYDRIAEAQQLQASQPQDADSPSRQLFEARTACFLRGRDGRMDEKRRDGPRQAAAR